jgi:hypothetical protein
MASAYSLLGFRWFLEAHLQGLDSFSQFVWRTVQTTASDECAARSTHSSTEQLCSQCIEIKRLHPPRLDVSTTLGDVCEQLLAIMIDQSLTQKTQQFDLFLCAKLINRFDDLCENLLTNHRVLLLDGLPIARNERLFIRIPVNAGIVQWK